MQPPALFLHIGWPKYLTEDGIGGGITARRQLRPIEDRVREAVVAAVGLLEVGGGVGEADEQREAPPHRVHQLLPQLLACGVD